MSLPPTSGGHHDLLVEWPITGIVDWPALTGDVGWKPVQGDARRLPAGVSRWALRTAACLVDLATQLKTGRIVTLGSDFRVYRWGRNRPFDLLLDS